MPSLAASLLLAATPFLVDRIVAVVDDHAITQRAVEARMRELAPSATGGPGTGPWREAVDSLIDEQLVRADANRMSVTVGDDDVERALEEVAKQNSLTVEQLLVEAKKQGFEPSAYRASLKRQLLEMRWLTVRVEEKRPEKPDEYAGFMAAQRKRLLFELRSRAAIEVRR